MTSNNDIRIGIGGISSAHSAPQTQQIGAGDQPPSSAQVEAELKSTTNASKPIKSEIRSKTLDVIGLKASAIGLGIVGVLISPISLTLGPVIGLIMAGINAFKKRDEQRPIGGEKDTKRSELAKKQSNINELKSYVKAGAIGYFVLAQLQWQKAEGKQSSFQETKQTEAELTPDIALPKAPQASQVSKKTDDKLKNLSQQKKQIKTEIETINKNIQEIEQKIGKIQENTIKEIKSIKEKQTKFQQEHQKRMGEIKNFSELDREIAQEMYMRTLQSAGEKSNSQIQTAESKSQAEINRLKNKQNELKLKHLEPKQEELKLKTEELTSQRQKLTTKNLSELIPPSTGTPTYTGL